MLELLSLLWHFTFALPAQSTLTRESPQAEFAAPAEVSRGFTVRLRADFQPFAGKQPLAEIPGVLQVALRQHAPRDRQRQNYPAYPMADGSVPVLEATVTLHSDEHPDWTDMTIGAPLALLAQPWGEHEVVLNFTGVRWTLYVDGKLLDNDFPFGYPHWAVRNSWQLNPDRVRDAALYAPAIEPVRDAAKVPEVAAVQYWTPPGHNAWVGDVATLFHQGRYHVFYLYDRRHHQSKFGKGAHYFEHLSTADLKTWTEHEAATPLDEQWECIGTGTPFALQGKLCIAYGLHTGRIYPPEKTTWPAQWDYLKKNGRTGEFKRASTPGYPAGSTYSVSTAGISRFEKSQVMFHPCQNPSVYTDPDGNLRLLANSGSKGLWASDSINGGWRCLLPDFPPGGDCTFFFRWGRFDYIIGGFKDLWFKPADAPDSAYASLAAQGLDCYDGLNVPAVSGIGGGRFLMAGWTQIRDWGGNLVIRELLQFPDGRLGAKWLDEITPRTAAPALLGDRVVGSSEFPAGNRSFLLSFQVHPEAPNGARCGIAFLPAQGERSACELQLRLGERRAQFGPGSATKFADLQKSLREGGSPQAGGNYAVENLTGCDKPFPVRILVKEDAKLGGALIDAEIAGQRTLLTYRPDLTAGRIIVRTEGLALAQLKLATLQ